MIPQPNEAVVPASSWPLEDRGLQPPVRLLRATPRKAALRAGDPPGGQPTSIPSKHRAVRRCGNILRMGLPPRSPIDTWRRAVRWLVVLTAVLGLMANLGRAALYGTRAVLALRDGRGFSGAASALKPWFGNRLSPSRNGGSYLAVLESTGNKTRAPNYVIGAALRDLIAKGAQVDGLIVPKDMTLLESKTYTYQYTSADGTVHTEERHRFGEFQLDLASPVKLTRLTYDPALSKGELDHIVAGRQVLEYPAGIHVVPADTREATTYVLHVTHDRSELYLVPLTVSPVEAP